MLTWKPSIVKTRRGHIGHIRTERTVRSFTTHVRRDYECVGEVQRFAQELRESREKSILCASRWKDPEWHQS